MKKIDWIITFGIIFLSVIILRDLFKPGMYTSHDGLHQVVRFFYFDQALRDGQIPPRWAQGLLNSFGYPLFIFSYHMPWFIAEVIHFLGFSIIDSVKYTFLAGFILSGFTMYLLQRDLFGRLAAVAATSLYLLAPYRFSNIFVRAAIGDATTFIFAPLVFWSLWRLKEEVGWKWVLLGSVSIAGLILSHAMVAVLFLSIFGLYFLFSLPLVKNKTSYIKYSILASLGGLGISAYYFIPSLVERSNTKFQELMGQIFVGNYFASVSDLIYSKWGYGVFHAKEGAMSIQLGIIQWLVMVFTLVYSLKILILDKKNSADKKKWAKEGIILTALFVFVIFMMLSISLPIWKTISSMVFIDFPWRYLAVSVFLVSLCSGFLIKILNRGKIIFTTIFIVSAFYLNRNHLHINEILPWDLSFILKLEKTTNSYDEYTPKWVKNEYIKENLPRVVFAGVRANAENLIEKSNSIQFSLNAPEAGIARINTIYYPGWKVWVDGKEENIDYSNGLMELKIEKGKKNIVARFTETPIRLASNLISIVTLVGLISIPKLLKKSKTK